MYAQMIIEVRGVQKAFYKTSSYKTAVSWLFQPQQIGLHVRLQFVNISAIALLNNIFTFFLP